MKKTINNTQYVSPSIEALEIILEGSILTGSGGNAGGDAGGEDGWDD